MTQCDRHKYCISAPTRWFPWSQELNICHVAQLSQISLGFQWDMTFEICSLLWKGFILCLLLPSTWAISLFLTTHCTICRHVRVQQVTKAKEKLKDLHKAWRTTEESMLVSLKNFSHHSYQNVNFDKTFCCMCISKPAAYLHVNLLIINSCQDRFCFSLQQMSSDESTKHKMWIEQYANPPSDAHLTDEDQGSKLIY